MQHHPGQSQDRGLIVHGQSWCHFTQKVWIARDRNEPTIDGQSQTY